MHHPLIYEKITSLVLKEVPLVIALYLFESRADRLNTNVIHSV
jgi:hypothetical protein